MARVRDGNTFCGRCGERVPLTRQEQEECRPCRRLRAVRHHAAGDPHEQRENHGDGEELNQIEDAREKFKGVLATQ